MESPEKRRNRQEHEEHALNPQLSYLMQSEAFLGAMFECSASGLIITDIDLTIVRYNPVAEHFFDKFLKEDLSRTTSLRQLIQSGQSEILSDALMKASHQENVQLTTPFSDRLGNTYWYVINILPIYNVAGDNLGISLSLEDISQVKNGEQLLSKRLRKLECYHSTLHQLLRQIHHVQSQLAGSLKDLIFTLKNADTEALKKYYLPGIEKSLSTLGNFIRDISIQSTFNTTKVQPQFINFSEIVNQLREELNLNAGNKVKFLVSLNEKSTWSGDVERIKSILANLVGNAMLYRDSSKPENIISLKVNVTQDQVQLVVADNGMGLPKAQLDAIYESTIRNEKSAGQQVSQLSCTRDTVQQLNGSIQVNSTPEVGTAFEISIPNLITADNLFL